MQEAQPGYDRLPNIALIMTDQQRADFTRAEGLPLDTTPFVDALGRRGARFARAYTPMLTCAPARCSLMSGRYPKATRVRENSGVGNISAPTDLLHTLREAGYSINLTGKNHTHLGPEDFDFYSAYMHLGGRREAIVLAGSEARAAVRQIVFTQHAQNQLVARDVTVAELLVAIAGAIVLEE